MVSSKRKVTCIGVLKVFFRICCKPCSTLAKGGERVEAEEGEPRFDNIAGSPVSSSAVDVMVSKKRKEAVDAEK